MQIKSFFSLVLLLASMSVLLGAEQKTGENLIKNGDFENGMELWKVSQNKINPSTIKIDDNVIFIDGSKSLRMDITVNPTEIRNDRKRPPIDLYYTDKIPCAAGKKFLLSGWIKASAGVKVTLIVDGGIYNKVAWFVTDFVVAKKDWTKFKKDFEVPAVGTKKYAAERKSFQLHISVPEDNTVDGTVWIDGLKIEEIL